MYTIEPLGDCAVTISFGEGISEELSNLVVASARSIEDADIIGVTDIVPSYAALSVHYDPLTIVWDDLVGRVKEVLGERRERTQGEAGHSHVIRVRYDGEDLDDVARATGLTTDEVISIHLEREYRVYVIGFVPGFAYLGTIDERIALPRRASPRKRVPAGSVAIAEKQTGIYPSATPGGWHLIGNTDVKLFDPAREQPALFRVGDAVRFEK